MLDCYIVIVFVYCLVLSTYYLLLITYCLGCLDGLGRLEQRKNPLIYSLTVNTFKIEQKKSSRYKKREDFSLIV